MSQKPPLVDRSLYDLDTVVADIEEIRSLNPQRFEIEQLSAVLYVGVEDKTCVGLKEVTDQEFWVRGHMPGMPLMPGVMMCEAAAQLTSFLAQKYALMGDAVIGFAGLENVRFRGVVRPGARLVIQAKLVRLRKSFITAEFMCLVDDEVTCEGVLKGVALPTDMLKADAGGDS